MKKKQYAARVHLGIGLQSFGNQTTILATKDVQLEVIEQGILCRGLVSKKKTLVPYANIKGIDFARDSDFMEELEEKKVIIADEPKPIIKAKK